MKLIHTFRPTRQGTIVHADRERREITWVPDGGEQLTEWTQDDRSIDWTTLAPGTRLRVQDGQMTRQSSDSRGGRRRYVFGNNGGHREFTIHTGKPCIDHVAHAAPRATHLAVRLMQHALGTEATLRHLRDWDRHASTRQTEIEVNIGGGRRLTLHLEMGVLECTLRLSPTVLVERNLIRTSLKGLPESMVAAMRDRPVAAVVGHPALLDRSIVIASAVENQFGSVELRLGCRTMTAPDAIALLEAQAAIAA